MTTRCTTLLGVRELRMILSLPDDVEIAGLSVTQGSPRVFIHLIGDGCEQMLTDSDQPVEYGQMVDSEPPIVPVRWVCEVDESGDLWVKVTRPLEAAVSD